jgi:hypothetical protein
MTSVKTDGHNVGHMKVIDRWLKKSGMSESRLGLLAAANPRAVERIRAGGATISTLNAVLRYIQMNPVSRTGKRSSSTS